MTACLETAETCGAQTIWLGVWEKNRRAIRFYEIWGFMPVGEKTFSIGVDIQTDVVMTRVVGHPQF